MEAAERPAAKGDPGHPVTGTAESLRRRYNPESQPPPVAARTTPLEGFLPAEDVSLVQDEEGGSRHDIRGHVHRPEEAMHILTNHLAARDNRVLILINEVGLEVRALDITVGEESVCLWVDSRTFQFSLPPTEQVTITLPGKEPIRCIYTGCWGKFNSVPDWAFVMFLRDTRPRPLEQSA